MIKILLNDKEITRKDKIKVLVNIENEDDKQQARKIIKQLDEIKKEIQREFNNYIDEELNDALTIDLNCIEEALKMDFEDLDKKLNLKF